MKRLFAICLAVAAISTGVAVSQVAADQTPSAPQAPTQQPATRLAASPSRGQVVDGVIATVNDQVISQSDVRNRMRMILMSFPDQPDEQILAEAQDRAIEMLINEKVEMQQFEKLVTDQKISDEEIDENLGDLARQNKMTTEQFLGTMRSAGISIQALREQTKAEIAWTALVRGRYGRQVRVSELRIDEMLDQLKANLNKPQYHLAEIFLFAPDQGSRDLAKGRAETLIKQINQGAEFQAVAQQFSAAPSASTGGDLGWMSQGDMRPEIQAALATAGTPPLMLPPIESEGGIYIVALLGKRDPSSPDAASMNLQQVVVRGDGAADKIAQIKSKATTCGQVADAVKGVEGVTVTPMNGVDISQVQPIYRASLQPLQTGQASEALDLPDGVKMMFYVCERLSGDPSIPSREEIRARLFNQELAMFEERYLRDLKREASIDRR